MTSIITTIEINRPAEDVFAYATDPTRFNEWQKDVVRVRIEGEGRPRLRSRFITTRRVGRTERSMTQEITEIDSPKSWAARTVEGPVRAMAKLNVVPLAGNTRSRLTAELDFEGHGIGRLIVPLVIRQTRKIAPKSYQNLKELLEKGI